MRAGMCLAKCIDFCIDMCLDMCVDMCLDMCAGMCIDMCVDMCIGMCVGMCIDMLGIDGGDATTSRACHAETAFTVPRSVFRSQGPQNVSIMSPHIASISESL